jgi:hypothetical protein
MPVLSCKVALGKSSISQVGGHILYLPFSYPVFLLRLFFDFSTSLAAGYAGCRHIYYYLLLLLVLILIFGSAVGAGIGGERSMLQSSSLRFCPLMVAFCSEKLWKISRYDTSLF